MKMGGDFGSRPRGQGTFASKRSAPYVSRVRELRYNPGFWSFSLTKVEDLGPRGIFLVWAFETEQDTEFSLYCEEF